MAYSAERRGGEIVLRDSSAGASARIRPELGNNVVSFTVTHDGASVEVLGPRGIPILFPFPNRVPRGRFSWRGREHHLAANERGRPNHNHGLVRDRAWTVDALDASSARASATCAVDLGASPDVLRQYPFPCRLAVTVALEDGALRHDATVTNTGHEPLPMGYGTHPWFPAALTGARGETQVRIPARRYWELAENIPTGRVLDAADAFDLRRWTALGDQAYDDVFTALDRRPDGWSEALVRYPADAIEVVVEADRAFREWVLFAPPSQPVIAIEPYTCATNAVNLEARGVAAGLVTLDPGATWRGRTRLSVRDVTAPTMAPAVTSSPSVG
jgi:aldose 1-epimerase